MPESLVTVAYIVAGLLFIMSLSGLSAQATAGRGNLLGIVGMVDRRASATRPQSAVPAATRVMRRRDGGRFGDRRRAGGARRR